MRWLLVLVLACSAAGCRRAGSQVEPASRPEPPALQSAPGERAGEVPAATAPADASPAPTQAPEAASAPAQPPKDDLTLPVIDLPPPVLAQAAPKKPEEQEDNRLYSWEDEHGVIQFGTAGEIPASRRTSAHVVDSRVTVIEAPSLGAPSLEAPAARPEDSPPPPQDAPQPDGRRARGPEPERDAQGLPIPGTMDDNAATRASRAAGESQIDPAAVQRRHEEELRRMNCKEKDGVWYCG